MREEQLETTQAEKQISCCIHDNLELRLFQLRASNFVPQSHHAISTEVVEKLMLTIMYHLFSCSRQIKSSGKLLKVFGWKWMLFTEIHY